MFVGSIMGGIPGSRACSPDCCSRTVILGLHDEDASKSGKPAQKKLQTRILSGLAHAMLLRACLSLIRMLGAPLEVHDVVHTSQELVAGIGMTPDRCNK